MGSGVPLMRKKSLLVGGSLTAGLMVALLGIRWHRHGAIAPGAPSSPSVPSAITAMPSKAIRFVPEQVEFGIEPVFSGDRVLFDVAVENTSSSPVRITEFPRSCGCMTFDDEGNLRLPATLGPGERFPLKVEVATIGRTGHQKMELVARGELVSGEPIAPGSLIIRGRIMTSILPLPEEIWLDVHQDERDSPIVRKVLLADEWPGDGLGIAKIESTARDRMRFGLAPATGTVLVGGLDVRKRNELTIRYTLPPDAGALDETITITPSHGSARPAHIRLHGRVLPDYEFQPVRLLFYGLHADEAASRVLVYHYHRPKFRDGRVVEIPEGVSVVEMPGLVEGTRRFRVTSRLPEGVDRKDLSIAFQIDHTGDTIQVPISMALGSRSAPAQEH